jgi:hypothetical protein
MMAAHNSTRYNSISKNAAINSKGGSSLMNPDSAVGIDAKSEEQTLRSKANGSLPLREHRSSVFADVVKPTMIDCEGGENDFETARLGVFTT